MSSTTVPEHPYYDISPLIHEGLAVFPGDQAFSRKTAMDTTKGDHLTLSSITSTVHLGAHADAPNHYHAQGIGADRVDVERYIGWCEVLRFRGVRDGKVRLSAGDFPGFQPKTPRVLVDTQSFQNPDHWDSNFLSLEPDLLEFWSSQGVKLVGIDTPSVDPSESKALESHQILWSRNLSVLEGLLLKGVPEGTYFLSALPLKIKDGDASPVRAVLWTRSSFNSWSQGLS